MIVEQEESSNTFSEIFVDHATNPMNVGSIPDADAYASVLGPCGDNMEVWFKVKDDRIKQITFWTDGCGATIACGSIATELARDKTLGEALAINAEVIARSLGGLPGNHIHCAGLASLTLKKTIIEYINLQKEPWKRAYRDH
jgi:nitrogen fixation NifU-like protein